VTLLYEPPKPAAVPVGEVKIEVWAVCTGQAVGRPGELSQKRLRAAAMACTWPGT
jgi:hypothetical protein